MAQANQRSLKNMTLTSKHHFHYVGSLLTVLLAFVVLFYFFAMYQYYSITLGRSDFDAFSWTAVLGLTIIGGILAVGVSFVGAVTAHRIAGVHVKLKNVMKQVEDGDLEAKLKFRNTDKLEDVEEAFNAMMASLKARIEKAEGRPKTEADTPSESND